MKLWTNASLLWMAPMATAAWLATGCSGNSPPPEPSGPPAEKVTTDAPVQDSGPTARPTMTSEECTAKGNLVYDMGDGKTHSPNYKCADGKSPIGSVPLGREGAVCCPK